VPLLTQQVCVSFQRRANSHSGTAAGSPGVDALEALLRLLAAMACKATDAAPRSVAHAPCLSMGHSHHRVHCLPTMFRYNRPRDLTDGPGDPDFSRCFHGFRRIFGMLMFAMVVWIATCRRKDMYSIMYSILEYSAAQLARR